MDKVVLIVDDCEDVADMCAFLFRQQGYDAEWASDGDLGLRAVAARRPDLIVLDMMMPHVDGLAFLERLPTVTSSPPPVIAYSGFDKFEELARSRGARAFLRKPFEPEQLASLARGLLDGTATPPRDDGRASEAARAAAAARREAFWRSAPPLSPALLVDLQRLVSGASRYFGAACAFVTALHGGALHVVAEHGAGDRFPAGCAMDPRVNFCPDVIAATTPLVVEDGRTSPAFAHHPAAAGDVRFYAGAPLVGEAGVALGTLCLEDPRGRSFAAEDLALVRHFARLVGAAIEADVGGRAWTALHADDGVVQPCVLEVLLDAEMRRAERDGEALEVAVLGRAADAGLATALRAAGSAEHTALAPHPDGAVVLVGANADVAARARMDALVRATGAAVVTRTACEPRGDALAAGGLVLVAQAWRALRTA